MNKSHSFASEIAKQRTCTIQLIEGTTNQSPVYAIIMFQESEFDKLKDTTTLLADFMDAGHVLKLSRTKFTQAEIDAILDSIPE